MLDALLDGLRRRDRRALARLITLASRGEQVNDFRQRLGPPSKPALVLAITGGGGVGKSTLVGKLIEQFRTLGKSVAVLACDPESPLTGGALLGDRFRMGGAPDDGVFIRSLAATSGRQAVADNLDTIVLLCEHFGFGLVLIETVGAGQGDTAVHSLADAVILLLQPETGDDLQWEKAGVLEVADAIVIHKADLPGAERAASQVKSALELAGNREVPIRLVSSRTGAGLLELASLMLTFPKRVLEKNVASELGAAIRRELAQRFRRPDIAAIADNWRSGAITTVEAIKRIIQ